MPSSANEPSEGPHGWARGDSLLRTLRRDARMKYLGADDPISPRVRGFEDAGVIARLRSSLTLVVEDLLNAEEACSRISSERLEGKDVLFPDVRKDLNERIEAAKMLSDCFSRMATEAGEGEISWEQIRTSVQPEPDQQVAG